MSSYLLKTLWLLFLCSIMGFVILSVPLSIEEPALYPDQIENQD
jgi:hypothetical protein